MRLSYELKFEAKMKLKSAELNGRIHQSRLKFRNNRYNSVKHHKFATGPAKALLIFIISTAITVKFYNFAALCDCGPSATCTPSCGSSRVFKPQLRFLWTTSATCERIKIRDRAAAPSSASTELSGNVLFVAQCFQGQARWCCSVTFQRNFPKTALRRLRLAQ